MKVEQVRFLPNIMSPQRAHFVAAFLVLVYFLKPFKLKRTTSIPQNVIMALVLDGLNIKSQRWNSFDNLSKLQPIEK
jgi:hypothetical protein